MRYLTVALALIESTAMIIGFANQGIFDTDAIKYGDMHAIRKWGVIVTGILAMTAGSAVLMWIGEQITEKGIGNGISIIIFIGIISGLPRAVTTIWNLIVTSSGFSTIGLITALGIIVGAIILVAGVVFVQQAERRVPVQYSKKVQGRKMVGAQSTHIPLKLVMAGVMPVIFASSFMTFPAMIISIFADVQNLTGFWAGVYKFSIATSSASVGWGYSLANAIVYLLLIMGFTFFYTYFVFFKS